MSRQQMKRKLVDEEDQEESITNDEDVDEDVEETVDTVDTFQEVDKLVDHGIPSGDLKKLKAAGIYTIKGIHMVLRKRLLQIKGLSEQKVDKIREAAKKVMNFHQFRTGTEVNIKRQQIFRVKTGCGEFDRILGGGIESMSITEVFGEYRCGKTQLAHTLSVKCQVVEDGTQTGKALFIDTENTFRPDRIENIAKYLGLDEKLANENVLHIRVFNTDHQCEVLDNAAEEISRNKSSKFRLLVVDSVMALFRVDFSGRGELADRQQKLAQFLSKLQRISEEYNLAVYITNQMTADPGAMSFAPAMKPIGGHILAHASATRVQLRKGRGEQRLAKICDSPDMPEEEISFAISPGGITDPSHQ